MRTESNPGTDCPQDEKQVLAQPSKGTDTAHANNDDRFTSEPTPNISYTGVEDSPGFKRPTHPIFIGYI